MLKIYVLRSPRRAVHQRGLGFNSTAGAIPYWCTTILSKAGSNASQKKGWLFVGFEAMWAKKARNFDLKRCCVSDIYYNYECASLSCGRSLIFKKAWNQHFKCSESSWKNSMQFTEFMLQQLAIQMAWRLIGVEQSADKHDKKSFLTPTRRTIDHKRLN